MSRLLEMLDAVINTLPAPGSSRCSRSPGSAKAPTGTSIVLINKAIPVVPVVPVAKQEAAAVGAVTQLIANLHSAPSEDALARILPREREQREQRELYHLKQQYQLVSCSRSGSRDEPENGNNGNSGHQPAPHRTPIASQPSAARFSNDFPEVWRDGLACLQKMACPAVVRPDRWQQLVGDASRFLGQSGHDAAAAGWDTASLFGVHPEKPAERFDCSGLIWLLRGNDVVAICPKTARIRTRSGAAQSYQRPSRPTGVLLWELR
jgi:hypothetical protein